MAGIGMGAARDLANKVETFVREVVVPYEQDLRRDHHGNPGAVEWPVQPHLSVDHVRCALRFASQAAWPFAKRCARCARAAGVQQGLAGTDVPVARIFAVCEDEGVIGSPFYVTDMVEGRVFWDANFSEMPKGQRSAYSGSWLRCTL